MKECPKELGPLCPCIVCIVCEEWYDTPREVSSTLFRDGIRHDEKSNQDFCARRLKSVQG